MREHVRDPLPMHVIAGSVSDFDRYWRDHAAIADPAAWVLYPERPPRRRRRRLRLARLLSR
jgi:hypothetical protein